MSSNSIKVIDIPNDFNYKIYLKLNPDLNQDASKDEVINHFIYFGKNENRYYKLEDFITEIPNDFDYKIYLKINPDLDQNCSEEVAVNHFKYFSKCENRKYKYVLPTDFDSVLYSEMYDLSYNDINEIYLHYNNNPNKQYRPLKCKSDSFLDHSEFYNKNKNPFIPNNFNWIHYKSLNTDLPIYTNKEDCISHFLNYGFKEKRSFHINDSLLYQYFNNKIIDKNINLYYILSQSLKDDANYKKNINKIFVNTDLTFLKFKTPAYNTLNNIIFKKHVQFDNDNHINMLDNLTNSVITDTDIYKYPTKININIDFLSLFDKFLLIIDAPDKINGGTRNFITSVITKFKYTPFLIIRIQNNNEFELNFNNKYYINKLFDEQSLFELLDINHKKIMKIFVNHFIFYPKTFIDKISNLNIHKSIITHDPFIVTNLDEMPHLLIDDYISGKFSNPILNKFDTIITQNSKNSYLFSNMNNLNELVISPLPDYFSKDKIIETKNSNIVVAIIGAISVFKGVELIKLLFDYYNNTNIKIVVFGCVSNFSNKNIYFYNNIDELNHLLITHNPNIIFETSIWPETYSYTLTLSMLTELPIITLNKYFDGVIANRLSSYNKTQFVKNLNELTIAVNKYKQDFFYTIKPVIYFNNFWLSYFDCYTQYFNAIFDKYNFVDDDIKTKITNKNVILITSKIYVSNVQFSYVNTRSIYTVEERLIQTIQTIESIRNKIPDSYIILMDTSLFHNKDYFNKLNESVDIFINITDNEFLNFYTNECIYKFMSDLSQQIAFYMSFLRNCLDCQIKNFFKISGRYYLNNNFNYEIYNNENNIFKINKNVKDREYFYTSFFKLNKNFLSFYFNNLIDILYNKTQYYNKDLEVIFGYKFKNDMTLVDTLGLTQRYSCWKHIDEI